MHSSDGVRGPNLADLTDTAERRSRLRALETDEVGWTVAPGLEYSRFTRSERQGPVQVHLLTARLDEPGLVLDQVSGTAIRSRAPLTQWLQADKAVAGVTPTSSTSPTPARRWELEQIGNVTCSTPRGRAGTTPS